MARTLRLILPIAIIAITTSSARATDSKEDSARDTFKQLDKNSDGVLAKKEFLGNSTGDKRIAAERRFARRKQEQANQFSKKKK